MLLSAAALFCPNCGTRRSAAGNDSLLGCVVGERFLIKERLGDGASGTIYRAEHVTLHRAVAVKVLHKDVARDPMALERFRREATTVGQIDNDHLVEVFDFGQTEDGRPYLSMQLLAGETLDVVLQREGRLPIVVVVDIIAQLADALSEAHALGYVHRDLRPRNIMLTVRRGRSNYVKLLDFGLAKLVAAGVDAARTKLGLTFAEPRYMSPEQARGETIDRRGDIYSLGCIAYEMLIGEPPFAGAKSFEILAGHTTQKPPPLAPRRGDIPAWLDAIVMRMLAKSPHDRFETVQQLVDALRRESASQATIVQGSGTALGTGVSGPDPIPDGGNSRGFGRRGNEMPAPQGPFEQHDLSSLTPVPGALGRLPASIAGAAHNPAAGKNQMVPAQGAAMAGAVAPKGINPTTAVGLSQEAVPAGPADVDPAAAAVFPSDEPAGSWQESARLASSAAPKPADRPASGKHGRFLASTTGSGLSSAWYADGAVKSGESEEDALSASMRMKLDHARSATAPSKTDLAQWDGTYFEERSGGRLTRHLLIGGAILAVLAVGFMIATKGPSKPHAGSQESAALTPLADRAQAVDASAPALLTPLDATAKAAKTKAVEQPSKPRRTTPARRATAPAADSSKPTRKPQSRREKAAKRSAKTSAAAPARAPTPSSRPLESGVLGTDSTVPLVLQPSAAQSANSAKAEFFAKLGSTALRDGDILNAASNFNKARSLDKNNVDARIGLGEIALSQGAHAAAVDHFRKAAALRPRSARIYTLLGDAFLAMGDKSSAAAAFKKALRIDPDRAAARDGYNEAVSR